MKIFHLSDLHIGKRVNEFSMLDDQSFILNQIIDNVKKEKADAVLIAGDVYDKAVPTAEAVSLFDDFLTNLKAVVSYIFIISGNHDSPERIAFGGDIMKHSGIYLSKVYSKNAKPIILSDSFGKINFYLLPFIKPQMVKKEFMLLDTPTYNSAVAMAVENLSIDKKSRNILLAHQFVTGASTCESEELSVGGQDNVDKSAFDGFDYVALGHIHGAQNVASNTSGGAIRYCGSPLKYSFSEINHKKSITVLDINEKGNQSISQIPLIPMRDMEVIKGEFDNLISKSFYEKHNLDNYYKVILTDENDIFDAMSRLREVYKNVMRLEYDNKRTQESKTISAINYMEKKSPLEHFSTLFAMQNNQEMSSEQTQIVSELIERIWGDL